MIPMTAMFFSLCASPARAEEPDHEIHEELRAIFRDIQSAINSGNVDAALPMLEENIAATSITQEVISSRSDVTKYFDTWFGEGRYMRTMSMALEADALTELSPDKRWGLVRGKGKEHYEANDGSQFDFDTRWTAVVAQGDDGKWRVKSVHIGTNHLDNPVLTIVSGTLIRNGAIATLVALVSGLGIGWFLGRRTRRA